MYTDKRITKIGVLARSSSQISEKTQDLLIVLREKGWAVGLTETKQRIHQDSRHEILDISVIKLN
jgi:hypothetical protein